MTAEITALYAGILALWLVALGYRIPALRRKHRIGIGTGGNQELAVTVRCHGNANEYIPVGIVLLLIAELNGAHALLLHGAGIALVLGRVLHAWGMTKTQGNLSFGRVAGMILTWTMLAVMALTCVYLFFM